MFTAKRKGLLAFFAVLLTVALISCAVIFALPEKTAHAEGAQTQTDEGQTDQTATVKSAEELKSALDSKEVSTIALGGNITANAVIAQGRTVTLDLNGFTLTNESDHTITNYGKLTIKDSSAENSGTVDNITNARGALFNLGEAVLLGGNYTRSKEAGSSVEEGGGNSWYAIKNLGYLTIGEDGKDCEVNVIQNGHFSSLITNGYYNSDDSGDHKTYNGLVTTADQIPTLTIYGGEFTGGINSIKNDNHGVMNIKGGIFNNSTQSVVLNWNKLIIDDGTFNIADDATASVTTSYVSTGFNNGNTVINGGTFAGAIVADYGADNVKYSISGGEFATAVSEEFIAEDRLFYPTENGFTVGTQEQMEADPANTAVAVIGKMAYASLSEAVDAVPADNSPVTITLVGGENGVITAPGVKIVANKNITIDFNGLTYNVTDTVGSSGTETNGFQLLKGSVVTLRNGKIISATAKILIQNYCNLTVEDMTLGGGENSVIQYVMSNNSGETHIKGNTNIIARDGGYAFDVYFWPSNGYTDVKVIFDEDFSGSVEGKVEYTSDNTKKDEWFEKAQLLISEGSTGNFDIQLQKVSADNPDQANIVIGGGTFANTIPESYISENSLFYPTEEGFKVVEYSETVPEDSVGVAVCGNKIYTSLQEAITEAEDGSTIKLLADIGKDGDQNKGDGSYSTLLNADKAVTLDLAGYNIYSGSTAFIVIYNGSLTVMNSGEGGGIVDAYGDTFKILPQSENDLAKLVLENGVTVISRIYNAVYLGPVNKSNNELLNAVLVTEADLYAYGVYATIQGNGNQHGTSITINGGKIYSKSAAIYHPQYGELVINGGEIVGEATGVEMRAGTIEVNGGTISGNGDPFTSDPNGNGSTTIGAAVAIVQHTTKLALNAEINGGEFNGARAFYQANLQNNDEEAVKKVTAQITGGQFNGEVSSENVVNFIEGGTFSVKPSDECFAEGFEGIFYDGNYVVVEKVSDAGALLTAKCNAQADVRSYAAAFGLSLTSLEALASADANAAAVVSAYEAVLNASSEGAIAVAKLAAMDAIDAFVDALNAAKAAAISEVSAYAADAENIAVAVPTYILSAINGAMSAEEINSYIASAKAEIDEVRAERKAAADDASVLQTQIDAIMSALELVQNSADANAAVLDDIVAGLAAAGADISDIQALLGNVADTSSNDTIIGMIKAVQDKVAEAQADIKSYVDEKTAAITADVEAMLAALDFADSSDIAALAGQLDEVSDYVYGIKASIGDLADGETLASVLAGIEYAQSALEKAVGDYKTAVETVLQGITESLSALVKDVEALSANSAADKEAMLEEIAKLQATADEISDTVASLESGSQTDLEGISEDIAKLNASLEGITENVDNLVKNNETYGSSLAGLYAFVAATVVIAIVVLVVVSVKKRR